ASGLEAGIADPREPAKVTGTASAAATVDGSDVTPADAAAILGGSDDDAPLLSECIEDDLAEWGYRFSMSELDDMLLCNGQPLSDAVAAQIRMDARDSGKYGGKNKIGLAAL